jgi:hypothetical protein
MDFKKDYYQILGVSINASKEEIRASYRRLAKTFHPDRNPNDADAEEKFKTINEANEVLSNDILRHEYDEYKKGEEEWTAKQKSQEKQSDTTSSKNKKTYTRKKTATKETRVYIRGEVIIKYWANQEEEITGPFQNEFKYKITPYDARLNITETNIYPVQSIPLDYLKAFKESDLFKSSIPQPVKCSVLTFDSEEYYELPLHDIRIKNIKLEGITKHEGQSFGTLKGDLFAYTPKFDGYEEEEEVTECFGETGKFETKTEDDITYYRKEFYHPDCTTYWSTWYAIKKPVSSNPGTFSRTAVAPATEGCLQWWWAPLFLLLIVLFPKFLLALVVLFLISLLLSFGSTILSSFSRLLSIAIIALFLWSIVSAIRSFSNGGRSYIKHDTPSFDSLSTTQMKVPRRKNEGDTSQGIGDTLITHFIRWKDYDSAVFETSLSIALSDLKSSIAEHNIIEPYSSQNPLTSVYTTMLESDNDKKLDYIYKAFDSLRTTNNFDELSFARAVVSCIQSIPYYLVVDKNCTDRYDDEFTRNYLATCNRDCCIGNEKFGVRSPIEFLSDLKGDCDTRAVFLYGLLKHYNYNVALITSEYYQHAMIAINFPGKSVDGLSMNIHDRNYYLWETTSAGFNAGQIPTYLQNLDYWDIALLNENK